VFIGEDLLFERKLLIELLQMKPLFTRWILFTILLSLTASELLLAQNYGLGFFSHDRLKEERTELNLTPNKNLKPNDNFTLSFDLNFHTRYTDRYGYVLRAIRNENESIDIVYSQNLDEERWYFYLIADNKTAQIPISIDPETLYQKWTSFNLEFDIKNQVVILSTGENLRSEVSVPLKGQDQYKLVFGACDFGAFRTRDVPVMNLRDVKITQNSDLKFHWPLDLVSGLEAKDIIRGRTASIRNPDWIKPKHEDWIQVLNTKQEGECQVAANYEEEVVYVIGKNQLISFSISDNSYEVINYENGPELLQGGQAFYNSLDNSIYSYNVDDKSFSSFDLNKREWNISIPKNKEKTIFLHHNKHFSKSDSALYIFGGYGQHKYKNMVQKYALDSDSWEILQTEGDFFGPRYLAAAGNLGDSVYIFGGYGSPSGDQMLNPNDYSDLMAYSISDRRWKRKFDLIRQEKDLCFSNSMVISSENRAFYALAFPRYTDDSYLQLIKGSLDQASYEVMGKKIPYFFHDTKSFADLFYFRKSNKLITYSSAFENEESTSFQLHSLLFPPNIAAEPTKEQNASSIWDFIFIIVGGFILVGSILVLLRSRRKKPIAESVKANIKIAAEKAEQVSVNDSSTRSKPLKNAMLFFGGFQVYDKEGTEITGKFTPLLKELFLLIWMHTLKNDKGISSERLTEILWFDKSISSARNNKAVNIAKLRSILSEVCNCVVTSKTGYWKIIYQDDLYNDYLEFLKITRKTDHITYESIKRLIKIVDNGAFLFNLNYEWLDEFKASISEVIIETLYSFAERLDINEDSGLIVQIAECIFSCDSINEEAMILKCKAHFEMGSHSLSKNTYEKFIKDYKDLYGQAYEKSFADITNKPLKQIMHS